jgi:hypothetical protein
VLVAATVPAAASSGQARPRAATTWDAQTLPALPGSAGSGLLFTPLTGVVVPLRTTGVSTSTEPTLEVDQLNVANVQFRVESLLTGRVQSSSNVRVDGGRARWLVPRGVLELAQNYQVSLIDAANTRNVVFAERNLHVDPQRSDEQKQWPFGGVSVAKVTGELHGLLAAGLVAGLGAGDTVAVFGHAVFLNAVAIAVAEAMSIDKAEELVAAMELGEAQGILCDSAASTIELKI